MSEWAMNWIKGFCVIVASYFLVSCNNRSMIPDEALKDFNEGKRCQSEEIPEDIEPQGVYGKDDRIEYYEIPSAKKRKVARSSVAIIDKKYLRDLGNGLSEITGAKTFQERYNVCSKERFSQQLSVVHCSGALVGKDLVLTAGHCYSSINHCENLVFVFDYAMTNKDVEPKIIPNANIYKCKEILVSEEPMAGDKYDYGVVRLTREVTDRPPLRMRRTGQLKKSNKLYVIGHPRGVLQKYAGNGKIRSFQDGYFVTTLDTYIHNSGSPVFNQRTDRIEGILVRGETDLQSEGTCGVTKICKENECRGQDVNSVSMALPYVPDVPDIVDENPSQPPEDENPSCIED